MTIPYDLSNLGSFKMWKALSDYHGTEALSHLGLKIWSLVSHEISPSLGDSKSKNDLDQIVSAGYAKNVYVK